MTRIERLIGRTEVVGSVDEDDAYFLRTRINW